MTPDWLPGVVPRCVPVETKSNQHGERSTTIVVGVERVLHRRRWRSVELLACPVTWRPHPEQITSARRGYKDWWLALDWVELCLNLGDALHQAARLSVSLVTSTPSLNLIPSMTFGN